jgi:hypothetical protein
MRKMRESQEVIQRIGRHLITEKKAAVVRSQSGLDGSSGLKKNDIEGSDLLSLLIKANMATDLPDHRRLSDEEILVRELQVV